MELSKMKLTVRAIKKICSIFFSPITSRCFLATLALSLNNNLLEVYSTESTSTTKLSAIELQGYCSELLVQDMDCVVYLSPVVGTKGGTLEIIDVRNGTCMEVVEARGGSVQPIAATADGFVTGITDHDVKFWEYQTTQKPGQDSKRSAVSPVRNLRMNDDVLVVAVSQKNRLEEIFEAHIGNAFENRYVPKEELPEGAVALAGKKTQETVNTTDSIIESIRHGEEELKRIAEYELCKVLLFHSLCATFYILI
ncbi:unnamed protein product [Fraxinus pennsylvanica]|uniref:Uncharacterized protein n=1 Tax=Fraxinus pennsylvanica TaxID=56036 RepID=A0AAD2A355_9LAMI|nr:unnamed protein product [Fraxinus pennsylvanica]